VQAALHSSSDYIIDSPLPWMDRFETPRTADYPPLLLSDMVACFPILLRLISIAALAAAASHRSKTEP